MDDIEVPMILCLLDQMSELPPQDFLAAAQVKHAQIEAEREKKGALSKFETVKGKTKRRSDGD